MACESGEPDPDSPCRLVFLGTLDSFLKRLLLTNSPWPLPEPHAELLRLLVFTSHLQLVLRDGRWLAPVPTSRPTLVFLGVERKRVDVRVRRHTDALVLPWSENCKNGPASSSIWFSKVSPKSLLRDGLESLGRRVMAGWVV